MRTRTRVFVVFACLLAAVAVGVCVPKALAQSAPEQACTQGIGTVQDVSLLYGGNRYWLRGDNADARALMDRFSAFTLSLYTNYTDAAGRPVLAQLALDWNYYAIVYDAAGDEVSVALWTHGWLFDNDLILGTLPDGTPDYAFNHPDCGWWTVDRNEYEGWIAGVDLFIAPEPVAEVLLPTDAELRLHDLWRAEGRADVACAIVDAWALNHATNDGYAAAVADCERLTADLAALLAAME